MAQKYEKYLGTNTYTRIIFQEATYFEERVLLLLIKLLFINGTSYHAMRSIS